MPAVPFKVKAVYEYHSEEPDDLNFPIGQIITVTDDADEDWYTGEYNSASGEKVEGIFPRNFVEKYEPAIPSRPTRAPKRAPAPEPAPEPAQASEDSAQEQHAVPIAEPEPDVPKAAPEPVEPVEEPVAPKAADPSPPAPAAAAAAAPPTSKPAVSKPGPPPVAEKPTTSSFKDRIAAFNKPAAAPVAPFKPGGNTSGFIKKPFVAPPPSKNSYVPPPREPPPQKVYQREEEATGQDENRVVPPPPPQRLEEAADEDQPKPTSLKERIALLQKQQLEQAQKHADAVQKKEKPKKPPKKRVESTEDPEAPPVEGDLEKADTNETVGRKSSDLAQESKTGLPSASRQDSAHIGPTPQPVRELVSDTNDADDSEAADTEDAQETSTEEERPRSKGAAISAAHVEPKKEVSAPAEDNDEDTEEEEEDPDVRRRRELRDRMARLGGGVGMMGMFGPPGGAAPPPARKSRPSQEHSRASEEQSPEETSRAPPVPIMALPGMSNQVPRRTEEPADEDSDEEDETAQPTPREAPKQADLEDDYISQPPPPPRRSDTTRSSASIDRQAPLPPQRENRAPPPPLPETRAVPPPPPSSGRAVPLPPPVATQALEQNESHAASPSSARSRRSEEQPMSPSGAPPVPGGRPRPDVVRKHSEDPSLSSSVTSPTTRAPPPPPPGPPSRRTTTDVSSPQTQQDDDSEDEVTEYDGDYDTDIASSAKHKDALKSHNRDSSIDDGVLTDDATKSPKSPPSRTVPPLPPLPVQHTVPPPPPPTQAPPSRKSTDIPRTAPPPVPPPAMPQHDDDDYDPYRYNAPSQGLPTPQLDDIYKNMPPGADREEEDMYGGSTQPPRMPPPPPAERSLPPPPTERAAPPPPPMERPAPPPPSLPSAEPHATLPKQSSEVRRSTTISRRSMEHARPSGEGFMAQDLDLGHSSFWWTQPNLLPPSVANRSDILYEIEENASATRAGRTAISKDIFVIYNDYSRTHINATFDKEDPSQVALEQTHERPPSTPRKDQLEVSSERFGAPIASAASNFGHQGAMVGDGSAQGFIYELLRPFPNALPPIGTRAYGALVYANLANASTQQYDEIRAGDIISFRNAKFSGHKGGFNAKYSLEAGKPDHVAVVVDWDGTKKKVRAWEQRSEDDRKEKKKAKVREESYRMGDLKSGEVRVWRIMGRDYVGWDKS